MDILNFKFSLGFMLFSEQQTVCIACKWEANGLLSVVSSLESYAFMTILSTVAAPIQITETNFYSNNILLTSDCMASVFEYLHNNNDSIFMFRSKADNEYLAYI